MSETLCFTSNTVEPSRRRYLYSEDVQVKRCTFLSKILTVIDPTRPRCHSMSFTIMWSSAAVDLLITIVSIPRVLGENAVTVPNTQLPSSAPAYNIHATVANISWLEQHNETWMNATAPKSFWFNGTDSNYNYEAAHSPARGPALPLAVRSPYTSAWTRTAKNGSLNSQ